MINASTANRIYAVRQLENPVAWVGSGIEFFSENFSKSL